jgi:GT2 family glycosyltransferase
MDVSIIYVNYNTYNLLTNSIQSVIELTVDISYEILIVDNNSQLEEKLKLQQFCTSHKITLIESDTNLGFGKANNLAAKQAKGKYLFFLNPDTYLINNAIKELYLFSINNNITTCGANLFSKEEKPIHSYWMKMPSISFELSALFSDIPLKIKHHNSHEHNYTNQPKEVAFITGATLMIQHSLFKNIGGFDPDYFMYFEETDLQLRIKHTGNKIYNLPTAKIIHLESQSLKSRVQKLKLFFTSRKIFYSKNCTKTEFTIANTVLKFSCIIRIFAFTILQNKEKSNYWKTILNQCL